MTLYPHQKEFLEADNDYSILTWEAGTGKTFLACVEAVKRLTRGDVDRLILTRPVVEAGEKLGFLPGDLYEKVNPYLRPLYDAFYTLMGPEKFMKYRKEGRIEIVPLAYMRGRTLDDAMVILDEAQSIKNPDAKRSIKLKKLQRKAAVAMTGTPVENRLTDHQ